MMPWEGFVGGIGVGGAGVGSVGVSVCPPPSPSPGCKTEITRYVVQIQVVVNFIHTQTYIYSKILNVSSFLKLDLNFF